MMIRHLTQTIWIITIALIFVGCSVTITPPTTTTQQTTNAAESTTHRVVIVPGYGAPVIGHERYQQYIQAVAGYVTQHADEISTVIFTGSYSALPDTSEATSMQQYFDSVMDQQILTDHNISVQTEQCAIMSWQNIKNSQSLLTTSGITPSAVTVFGDQARQDKLIAFANYYFNKQSIPTSATDVSGLRYTPIDFEGFDFGGAIDPIQTAQAAAELAILTDDRAADRLLAERIAQWTAQFHYDVATNLVGKGCSEFQEFTH